MPYVYVPLWIDDDTAAKLKSGEYIRAGCTVLRAADRTLVCRLDVAAEEECQTPDSPARLFMAVFEHRIELEDLSDTALLELVRFITTHPELSTLRFFEGSLDTVSGIIKSHVRMSRSRGPEESARYLGKKREALLNIFQRSFFSNLRHMVDLRRLQLNLEPMGDGIRVARGTSGETDTR